MPEQQLTKKDKAARRARLRPHAVRDQIVEIMRSYGRPISPTQISRITGGTLGSVAYHVRTLTAAGVVEIAEEGRVRGAVEHFYVLTAVDDGQETLSDPVTALLAMCGALTVPGQNGAYPEPASIDQAAREELQAMVERLKPKVRRVAAESTSRSR